MKFFILKLILLTALVVPTIFVLGNFDNNLRVVINPNIIRVHNALKYQGLDYLFTGSSYTYSAVIPSVLDGFGFKTYNLGIATSGPYFSEIIIDDYLSHCSKKPKALVFDVSLLTFAERSDSWASYPIHRYLSSPRSNENIVISYGLWNKYLAMVQKSAIEGFFNVLTNAYLAIKGKYSPNQLDENSTVYSEINSTRGFLKLCDTVTPEQIKSERDVFVPFKDEEFDNKKARYFLKMLKKYTGQGIKVFIIHIPTNMLKDYFSDNFKAAYDAFCESLHQDKDATYIDAICVKFNEKDFRNIDHINCEGAIKFSECLGISLSLQR